MPREKPVEEYHRLGIMFPRSFYEKLKRAADKKFTSVNQYVKQAADARMKREEITE